MKAISECGFEHPSEGIFLFFACDFLVQSQCIPKALMRGDILCQARSGMGKTCVFVISVLQNIKHSDHVRFFPSGAHTQTTCVVFSHTREMAIQITREFIRLGKYLPDIVIKTVFGGVPLRKSMADIKSGCDILVGTAGRIADLVRHKALDTSQLKFFVVDECDRQIETLCFPFFSFANAQRRAQIFRKCSEARLWTSRC